MREQLWTTCWGCVRSVVSDCQSAAPRGGATNRKNLVFKLFLPCQTLLCFISHCPAHSHLHLPRCTGVANRTMRGWVLDACALLVLALLLALVQLAPQAAALLNYTAPLPSTSWFRTLFSASFSCIAVLLFTHECPPPTSHHQDSLPHVGQLAHRARLSLVGGRPHAPALHYLRRRGRAYRHGQHLQRLLRL